MNILFDAILKLSPNANFYVENGVVIWNSPDIEMPSQAEIDTEVTKLQAQYDALQYQRDREPEYPSMADQLDYIYHNGIAKWKSDMVKPVKDAHPKPE